ncbi:MAG: threonine--tRNA ligase [Patescibacteria group bacterium]
MKKKAHKDSSPAAQNNRGRSKSVDISHIRHSLAHLLAAAMMEKFPKVQLGIGPVIEDGFYYDFKLPKPLTPEDLPKLEKAMRELIRQNLEFTGKTTTPATAKKTFKNQPYKIELIDEIKKNKEKPVVYKTGGIFTDLCAGGHVSNTKEINPDGFRLTHLAGAYWRGNEKNDQLTRVYGIAFHTKTELENYMKRLEEAEKRDHRKLGKQLDLFVFSDLVGPGLPLFTPKGTIIKDELQKCVEEICRGYGFEKVATPHLAKIELYKLSGHADKFSDELFRVTSNYGHEFVMKPVQCPHQTQIYASQTRSYRDLPIRYMESEKQYRAEKSGEIGGLTRVYAITVEDGHSFCRIDQVKDEIKSMVHIIENFYRSFGLWGDHSVALSVRDPKHPEKYIGEKKDWDQCEKILEEVVKEMNLGAERCEGEAALYGPKIDFMFKDAMGKKIQIPTVQIDFVTPKRFGLSYVDKDGKEKPPVMVHRAILGSYERFIALILEHFYGHLPTWLSPVQATIISVGANHEKYAKKIFQKLAEEGIRVKLSGDSMTVGKRIREAEIMRSPYILVVGDREISSKAVNVRHYKKKDPEMMDVDDLLCRIKSEIAQRK